MLYAAIYINKDHYSDIEQGPALRVYVKKKETETLYVILDSRVGLVYNTALMTGEQRPVPQLDLLGLTLGVEFNECSIAAAELNEQVPEV